MRMFGVCVVGGGSGRGGISRLVLVKSMPLSALPFGSLVVDGGSFGAGALVRWRSGWAHCLI